MPYWRNENESEKEEKRKQAEWDRISLLKGEHGRRKREVKDLEERIGNNKSDLGHYDKGEVFREKEVTTYGSERWGAAGGCVTNWSRTYTEGGWKKAGLFNKSEARDKAAQTRARINYLEIELAQKKANHKSWYQSHQKEMDESEID